MDYYKNQHALIKSLTEKLGPQFRFHFHGDMVTVVGAADATEVFNHPDLSFMQSQNKVTFPTKIKQFRKPNSFTLVF